MAGQERKGRPDGLLVIQENEFRNREFAKVTDSTSQCLDFLKDDIPDKTHAREYLATDTDEFLKSIQRGFLDNILYIAGNRNVDAKDMRMFAYMRENLGSASEVDNENFQFSLVTFCIMPDSSQHNLLPTGFSRRGALAPPFTLSEYNSRIRELKQVNDIISSGGDVMEELIDLPVFRYGQFHRVGSKLPLVEDRTKKEAEEYARDAINKMVDDVEI